MSNKCDTYSVTWHVIQHCNYGVSTYSSPTYANGGVYSWDRLLIMAEKLVALPMPNLGLRLTGGEPTLHPLLPQLLARLLKSRPDISLTLETNGSRDLNYYRTIPGASQKRFKLDFNIYPAVTRHEHLLKVAAALVENGFSVHLRILNKGEAPDRVKLFRKACIGLAKILPVTWEEVPTMGGVNQNGEVYISQLAVTNNLVAFADKSDQGTLSAESDRIELRNSSVSRWCCQGANFLLIEPDGYFYGAPCPMRISPRPLWHELARLPEARIYNCAQAVCNFEDAPPNFPTLQEAREYLGKIEETAAYYRYSRPLSPLDPTRGLSISQIILARLRRLESDSLAADCQSSQPIWQRWHDIVHIYEALKEPQARDACLRILKYMESGNRGFLEDARHEHLCEIRPAQLNQMPFTLELSQPVTLDILRQWTADIRRSLPIVRCRLPLKLNDFLNVLLYALKIFTASRIDLYLQNGTPWLEVIPQVGQAPILSLPNKGVRHTEKEGPYFSIIIVCKNQQDALRCTLGSVLLQKGDKIEIIVVNANSTDATASLLKEYQEIYPERIDVYTMEGAVTIPEALNYGIRQASGAFAMFLSPGHIIPPGCLAKASCRHWAHAPQIIIGRATIIHDDCLWPIGIDTEAHDGQRHLKSWVEAWAEGFPISGCLYSRKFLEELNLLFTKTGSYPYFRFGVLALLAARHIEIMDDELVRFPYTPETGIASFGQWLELLDFINNIVEDYNLPATGIFDSAMRRILDSDWGQIRSSLKVAQADKSLFQLLTPQTLSTIGKNQAALSAIIELSARLFCNGKRLKPKIASQDLDWRLAATRIVFSPGWIAYHDADHPDNPKPKISIITPNYNKLEWLPNCLNSVLAQTLEDFEFIIVDDCSNDGSWELLKDYADYDPRIRLYRMNRNCRQGICRNLGIAKARGDYLVFPDSDDLLTPEFLEYAYKEAILNNADIVMCSSRNVDLDGKEVHRTIYKDERLTSDQAFHLYEQGKLVAAAWGKIFSARLVNASGARFEEFIFHQDHRFTATAIQSAKTILTRSFIGATYRMLPISSIRPETFRYIQIYSALRLYRLFQEQQGTEEINPDVLHHLIYNIRLIFAPAIFAFLENTGTLPMTEEDFALASSNLCFIAAILYFCIEQGWRGSKKQRHHRAICCFWPPELPAITAPDMSYMPPLLISSLLQPSLVESPTLPSLTANMGLSAKFSKIGSYLASFPIENLEDATTAVELSAILQSNSDADLLWVCNARGLISPCMVQVMSPAEAIKIWGSYPGSRNHAFIFRNSFLKKHHLLELGYAPVSGIFNSIALAVARRVCVCSWRNFPGTSDQKSQAKPDPFIQRQDLMKLLTRLDIEDTAAASFIFESMQVNLCLI